MSRRRRTGRQRLAAFVALVAAACLTALGTLLLTPGSAGAADTVKAQLSLTGIATSDNPTGGSVLGIHPGDTVSFTAATLPTAGLDKLGLGNLVDGLLGGLTTYQVTVDFSGLPNGAKSTVLTDKTTKSFTFSKAGTYNFTWQADSVLLGNATPIDLSGNSQLAAAGVKLNAKTGYVGQIVVATNPPAGGISVQLPGVSVQPSLPVVGTLPKVSLPGVTTPKVPVTLPNLNPGTTKTGKGDTSGKTIFKGTGSALPVPALVVPKGTGKVIGNPDDFGPTTGTTIGGSSDIVPVDVAPVPGITSTASKPKAKSAEAPAAKNTKINAGTYNPSSSGLPVVLAIVAMLALVLVAGTYARLFLLRKPPA